MTRAFIERIEKPAQMFWTKVLITDEDGEQFNIYINREYLDGGLIVELIRAWAPRNGFGKVKINGFKSVKSFIPTYVHNLLEVEHVMCPHHAAGRSGQHWYKRINCPLCK